MNSLYLVLRHRDVRSAENSRYRNVAISVSHPLHREFQLHDSYCECLRIEAVTKTREEADKYAEDLMTQHPDDLCWSVEIPVPK